MGPSKGVAFVACHSFCNCSVTCSIVPVVAVAFEQKQKLHVGLVMLHAVYRCRKIIVTIFLIVSVACLHFENGLLPHFLTMSPVSQNP